MIKKRGGTSWLTAETYKRLAECVCGRDLDAEAPLHDHHDITTQTPAQRANAKCLWTERSFRRWLAIAQKARCSHPETGVWVFNSVNMSICFCFVVHHTRHVSMAEKLLSCSHDVRPCFRLWMTGDGLNEDCDSSFLKQRMFPSVCGLFHSGFFFFCSPAFVQKNLLSFVFLLEHILLSSSCLPGMCELVQIRCCNNDTIMNKIWIQGSSIFSFWSPHAQRSQ